MGLLNTKATKVVLILMLAMTAGIAHAACRDAAVLVHGNTGKPSDWDNTRNRLLSSGWTSAEIIRPNWGSKTCATCNAHTSSNLDPVKSALRTANSRSCTGRIAVIGHSMGVTLAGKAIRDLGYQSRVRTFVGVAGALRGLNSCGTYPYNVNNATCGKNGLSKKSPFLEGIKGQRFGTRMYSIKSFYDQVVCLGSCYVSGTHTSNIWNQNATYTYNNLGHFGLQKSTTIRQRDLIK